LRLKVGAGSREDGRSDRSPHTSLLISPFAQRRQRPCNSTSI
jgi:hypothetical protein